jgi:hypothetical protein
MSDHTGGHLQDTPNNDFYCQACCRARPNSTCFNCGSMCAPRATGIVHPKPTPKWDDMGIVAEGHVQVVEATKDRIGSYVERKQRPLCTGLLDYFPDALLEVAYVSWKGNQQHNPGETLHWARDKSIGEGNEILRHMIDRGKKDTDGIRHMAKAAWRALELLQREIDAEKITGIR